MKLTDKQRSMLWGEYGPHSVTRLIFESGIFSDEISVNLLLIEVSIDPLTWEIVEKSETRFKDDSEVNGLIENSHYQGDDDGYITRICFGKFDGDEAVLAEAKEHLESIQKALIRMHGYAIEILEMMEE